MCGRFAMTLPQDAMAQLFEATPANDLPQGANYNVCPTNAVAVATSEEGNRRVQPMRWGFLPHWYKAENGGPLLINARAETIAEKPAFKSAARARRCLIPATGFYEWTKDANGARDPWYIYRSDGAPLVFAGVWQDWERDGLSHRTCAIVTCSANAPMSKVHHRMPVVLEAADWPLWLGEAGHGAARLMVPAADETLRFHRVDRAVNSNRAAGPELIERLA
ncbi:SOS response-associated peptidase [Primorskyibacter sp. S187A]|uniref:SOS response-associated peptidase n=1 Tax=Primorskyibacter sp. S187A TaxID=3415130 RepID=UPI003C7E5884